MNGTIITAEGIFDEAGRYLAPALIVVCAWCTPRAEQDALALQHPGQVSHGICPSCAAKLEAGQAA
jgi:hypothetical protein